MSESIFLLLSCQGHRCSYKPVREFVRTEEEAVAFWARSAASVWNLSRCSIEYDVMPISLSGKSAKSPVSAMAIEYLCTKVAEAVESFFCHVSEDVF